MMCHDSSCENGPPSWAGSERDHLDCRLVIGVIGAGAMGGAMAVQLARAGNTVTILATEFDEPFLAAHRDGKDHPALGTRLPNVVIVEHADWPSVLPQAELLVLAVATVGLVPTVRACAPHVPGTEIWAVATKGFDEATRRSAHAVVAEEVGDEDRVVAVVGPSIASEIALGVPTAVVCASTGKASAQRVATLLDSPRFRTYTSDDVVGVEVGAIMKNVLAIGIGMADGLADAFEVPAMTNAKAFLFSRGLVEMAKLARALGGRAETILGLAGAGDLFVTALSGRNGRFGRLIGEGRTPEDALDEMNTTVEGYVNARTARELAHEHRLDLPVVEQVAAVLYEGRPPRTAIEALVSPPHEDELT